MKKRAVMRDQIPLHRPLFGVEPSGRNILSNTRASSEEWLISSIFIIRKNNAQAAVVKNFDSWTRCAAIALALGEC